MKEKYQNRGLGKQILAKVIYDMKANNISEIWAVTTDDHPFWSNVWNKSFTARSPADGVETSSGYFLNISDFDRLS